MTARDALAVLSAVLMLSGGLLSVAAAAGLLRLPDVAARLQAATKPQVLGLLLVMAGAAPYVGGTAERLELVLVALFQLITSPILGQLLARSAYTARALRRDLLILDEIAEPPQDGARR